MTTLDQSVGHLRQHSRQNSRDKRRVIGIMYAPITDIFFFAKITNDTFGYTADLVGANYFKRNAFSECIDDIETKFSFRWIYTGWVNKNDT